MHLQKLHLTTNIDFNPYQESKEYTLSLGRNHNKTGRARKEATLYSESEEYDDTDTSGGETSGMTTSLHQNQQKPIPPMHQNIFSTSSNIHSSARGPSNSVASSANIRMSHPPSNGTPLPQVRQSVLNNQQPDPLKRQSVGGGREGGVVMGERSLLTNRITNFNNNTNGGGLINNNQNQQHRYAVNSAINNLNTQLANNSSSAISGANNLLGTNSADYRAHLNL